MTHDTLKDQWPRLTGKVRTHWGRLTRDDCADIDGEGDRLATCLQLRYGLARQQAEEQVRAFVRGLERASALVTAREKSAAGL